MRRRVAALAAVGLGTGLLVSVSGSAQAAPGTVVISQVYGGGGNLGAPSADTCDIPVTRQIAEIQGPGAASPLVGQNVRFEGVVTGDYQGSNQLNGFFVQDDTPDADPATSDGLFIYSTKAAAVGDRVRVTGKVTEFGGATELTNVTDVNVCGTATITPTVLSLPLKAGLTKERHEGVLVTLPEALTVSELHEVGRYGEVMLAAGGSRLWTPTSRGDTTRAENAARSLLLDDGSSKQNPPVTPYLPLRIGDKTAGLTGVIHEGYGSYLLEPTQTPVWHHANPRRDAPGSVGAANVRIASFNTLNWFQTLHDAAHPKARGADTLAEQQRQLAKEIETLAGLDADIVGLMEIENNGETGALKVLVDALNAKVGAGTYTWIDHPSSGTDAIQVSVIYRPAKVTPIGAAGTIDATLFERRPLIQRFERVGGSEPVTLIVNHWKSKGCGAASGANLDHGQGCWNARRTDQANAISAVAKTLDNPLVIGDLNAYSEEGPIHVLENGGLIGQSEKFEPKSKRYSYVYAGMSGELDHVMAGPKLTVTGLAIWHINADEATVLDYNQEFNPPYLYAADEYRSSDHDPVVVGLHLK
jgi:predicted extracellular nuclease